MAGVSGEKSEGNGVFLSRGAGCREGVVVVGTAVGRVKINSLVCGCMMGGEGRV